MQNGNEIMKLKRLLIKVAKEFRECECDTWGTLSAIHFGKLAEECEKAIKQLLTEKRYFRRPDVADVPAFKRVYPTGVKGEKVNE